MTSHHASESEIIMNRLSSMDSDGYSLVHAPIDIELQEVKPNPRPQTPNQMDVVKTVSAPSPMAATTNIATPVGTSIDDIADDYEALYHIHTPPSLQPQLHSDIHNQKLFRNIICSVEFMGRIFLIILNLFLLTISGAYCVGQWYQSTLYLVKQCKERTIEQIWKHSYNAGVSDNGDVEMTEASMHGQTNEPCWTTKTLDTNTDPLWYSNVYIAHPSAETRGVRYQSVLFGLLGVYCLCIIVYNVYTLVIDCRSASKNELHTRSRLYRYFIENQTQMNTASQPPHIDSWLRRKMFDLRECWLKYMVTDTTGWIIRGVLYEISEIIVQTNACALYNGYNMLDPRNKEDIYLANQSQFITIFAVILSLNCFGSGLLWLCYSLLTEHCHGLLFKLLLFCVDEISDLFYTLFPFIVIFFDEYNDRRDWDIYVFLAELNTSTAPVAFLSAFMPLWILCTKSLFIIRSSRRQLADRCYSRWKFLYDLTKQKDDQQAIYQAQLAGYQVNLAALQKNKKEIYSASGTLLFSLDKVVGQTNWIKSGIEEQISVKRRCILIMISLIYIVYGIGVLWVVMHHLQHAKQYCAMISEPQFFMDGKLNINSTILNDEQSKLLQRNPELFFWDHCLYKMYPFVNRKDSTYNHPCQCRVFVIDWDDTISTATQRNVYFNLTQPIILTNMLTHWFSLEKFRTNGKEKHKDISIVHTTRITKDMNLAK
eukprot:719810_1